MSARIPESIEADAEDLAHGTELTTREAVVVLCDREGLENESIRAYLGKTATDGEVLTEEIGRMLGKSTTTVEDIRSGIRQKKRDLQDRQETIAATLEELEAY